MKYEVFFLRTGYAEIDADTPEDAKRIADKLQEQKISWTDDWEVDAIQEQESIKSVYWKAS